MKKWERNKEAFVYCWVNSKNHKMYIGIHCGNRNDGYISSSRYMQADLVKEPSNFRRVILAEGSYLKMTNLESLLLLVMDAQNNPNFYNKHNTGGAKLKSKIKHNEIKISSKTLEKICSKLDAIRTQ